MNKTSLLVWVPLRPGSHWRAEGIAQTIENALSEINNLNITILVNKEHYYTLEEQFEAQDNVNIIPLSFKWLLFKIISERTEIKKYNSTNLASYEISTTKSLIDMFLNKIFSKFQKINLFSTSIGYAVRLKIFTLLQRTGHFRQYQKIWLPVPIIPWIAQLKGETILSFWDPFGFEYREFSDISPYLHENFLVTFNKVTHIITQSNNNKDYLTHVFGIDDSKISVVYLGYPDYSKFVSTQANNTKDELLASWKVPVIKSNDRAAFMKGLHKELINHSMLFRLHKRLDTDTKIIIISTQHRPYKGFETLFKILEILIKNYSTNIYFIFTGLVPGDLKEKYAHFHENIVEINRVSNKQHALLYLISDLALHPSYAEGGLGTYPQFEAASVGTPCIINRGRHTDEMIKVFDTNLSKIVSDFTDTETSVQKIIDLLDNKKLSSDNVQLIMNSHRSWTTASQEYETIFTKESSND